MKVNKRIATICFLSAIVCSSTMACSNKTNTGMIEITNPVNKSQSIEIENPIAPDCDIKSENIMCMGQHLYYPADLLDDRPLTKDQKSFVKNYLKDVDSSLTEDVYVYGFNSDFEAGKFRIFGWQYLDGAVIPTVTYSTDLSNTHHNIAWNQDFPLVASIDTTGLLDPESFVPTVSELAESHKHLMMINKSGNIYGTYRLEYDVIADKLVYRYELNEFSHIEIDAKTGEIFREYYWNGEYED